MPFVQASSPENRSLSLFKYSRWSLVTKSDARTIWYFVASCVTTNADTI